MDEEKILQLALVRPWYYSGHTEGRTNIDQTQKVVILTMCCAGPASVHHRVCLSSLFTWCLWSMSSKGSCNILISSLFRCSTGDGQSPGYHCKTKISDTFSSQWSFQWYIVFATSSRLGKKEGVYREYSLRSHPDHQGDANSNFLNR